MERGHPCAVDTCILADRPDLTVDVLERTSTVMDRYFPDAVVTGYSARAAGLDLPDPDDIHVLAAAIEAGADTIVTRNLRDFPSERLAPHDLTAKHPDVFIADLFVADPEAVLAAVRGHRVALRNPPRTANEHVDALKRLGLIRTASLVRPHRNSI